MRHRCRAPARATAPKRRSSPPPASVFATLGYLNTKIADISAAAGRSTASFYNYYDNKEQILEALLGDFATSVVEASLTTGHHDPYEGVTAAVTAYWKMYKEYLPEMIGLQQMALTDPGFRQRLPGDAGRGIKADPRRSAPRRGLGLHRRPALDLLASALTSTLESNCSVVARRRRGHRNPTARRRDSDPGPQCDLVPHRLQRPARAGLTRLDQPFLRPPVNPNRWPATRRI